MVVPLLPAGMYEFCMASFPFVIGVTANVVSKIESLQLEEVVWIDLDKRRVRMSRVDIEMIPLPQFRKMVTLLQRQPKNASWNAVVQDAFLDFFVSLFGCYRDFLNSAGIFDKEAFFVSL